MSAVDANVSKCSFTYWTLSLNLEARALASRRLLLHGLDRHDLVLELASGLRDGSVSRVRREARRWRRINQRALATNRGEEVVDNLVLLDRPEFGKNSKENGSEQAEGAVGKLKGRS